MSDFYFSTNLTNDRMLCLSPITDEMAAAAGDTVENNPVGYFLYERSVAGNPDDISILARVISEDAAWALRYLLNLE